MQGIQRRTLWSLESDLLFFSFLPIAEQSSRLVLKSGRLLDKVGKKSSVGRWWFLVPIVMLLHNQCFFSSSQIFIPFQASECSSLYLLFSWNFAGEFKWAIRLLGEQGIQRQGEWIVSGEDTSGPGRDPLLVPADRAWPPLLTPSVSIRSLLLCIGCTPGILSVSGLGFTSFSKFWICIHPLPKSCTWIYLKSTCLPGFGSQFFSSQGIIQLILCPLIRSHPSSLPSDIAPCWF